MALRSGHGNGAGQPRVEVLPVDELPVGTPDCAGSVSPSPRAARGHFARGNHECIAGGKATAGKTRLAVRLGLGDTFADPRFAPYALAARRFRVVQVATLAKTIGGGFCGPGPSSIVASASLQLAASRYAFEVLGNIELGSKLANDSRQNLLAAHELCAREAKNRPHDPSAIHRRIEAAFGQGAS
jgi:hypothetical protein